MVDCFVNIMTHLPSIRSTITVICFYFLSTVYFRDASWDFLSCLLRNIVVFRATSVSILVSAAVATRFWWSSSSSVFLYQDFTFQHRFYFPLFFLFRNRFVVASNSFFISFWTGFRLNFRYFWIDCSVLFWKILFLYSYSQQLLRDLDGAAAIHQHSIFQNRYYFSFFFFFRNRFIVASISIFVSFWIGFRLIFRYSRIDCSISFSRILYLYSFLQQSLRDLDGAAVHRCFWISTLSIPSKWKNKEAVEF